MTDASRPPETFLGGRVLARQPARGYRAAVDTVLLGAAITARPGERVLELGTGSGAAMLVAAERNPGATFLGVERDPALADLARANAAANPTAERVAVGEGDVLRLGPDWRDQFDQVMLNPPFMDDPAAGRLPRDPERRAAFVHDAGSTADWIAAAVAAVKTRGRITLVHRADALADLLAALDGPCGAIRVLPVYPKVAAPARRALIQARKGARTPFALLPGLVLHDDEGGWTERAHAILAGEQGLAFEA